MIRANAYVDFILERLKDRVSLPLFIPDTYADHSELGRIFADVRKSRPEIVESN
jgi:hypothetical protein